jgi:hypothetical protein
MAPHRKSWSISGSGHQLFRSKGSDPGGLVVFFRKSEVKPETQRKEDAMKELIHDALYEFARRVS